MLGLRYMKTSPTTYVMLYQGGKVTREGAGLAFLYYAPASVVVNVPMGSVDVPFAFEETSADFQVVTVQGQVSYRIAEPQRVAAMLDFSILPSGRFASDDPQKLSERIVSTLQVLTSAVVHRLRLRELLGSQPLIVEEVLAKLRTSEVVTMLGVQVLGLSILAIKPSPETSKALEAEAREQLLGKADEAIYARRNAAVEQERLIKESELNTEMAVEEKRRQMREKKMTADIALEQQRQALIDSQSQNEQKAADMKAYALEAQLKPLRQTDWRVLMAASSGEMDPRTGVALALRELAENAGKIGQFSISPDLLTSLIDAKPAIGKK